MVVAKRTIRKGEEVTINYGNLALGKGTPTLLSDADPDRDTVPRGRALGGGLARKGPPGTSRFANRAQTRLHGGSPIPKG